ACLGHGARDVVELQIEEDVTRVPVHHADHFRSGVEEELLADLERPDLRGEQLHQALGLGETIDVEGEDEPVPERVGGAANHCGTCRGPTSAATRATTSATGTSVASAAARGLTSTQPRPRAPRPTRTPAGH